MSFLANVPTRFSAEPPRPIMIPFWDSRSTYIKAIMCMEVSSSLNCSTATSTA